MEKVRFILAMLYFIFLCLFSCHSLRAQGLVYYGSVLSETLSPDSIGGSLPEGFYFVDLETGDMSQWDSSNVQGGGSIVASTDYVWEGSYSQKMIYGTDDDLRQMFNVDDYLGGTPDTLYVSWWTYFPTPTASHWIGLDQDVEIARIEDPANVAPVMWVFIDSVAGGYGMVLGGRPDDNSWIPDGDTYEDSLVFSYNTWYNIQIMITHSSTGVCSLWVDNEFKDSLAPYDTDGRDFYEWHQGGDSFNAPDGFYIYYLDYVVFDTSKIVY